MYKLNSEKESEEVRIEKAVVELHSVKATIHIIVGYSFLIKPMTAGSLNYVTVV